MKLKVTNKRLDTNPIKHRLTQGEALVDRPQIVLSKVYEGLDISGLNYEIRAVSDKETMVRRNLAKTVSGDELILTWTVTKEFTAVEGGLSLAVIGLNAAGTEIIKITSEDITIRPDPEGDWVAPPPDLIADALNQMAAIQGATYQAKADAEAARDDARDHADDAAESARQAAASAAGAAESKEQTDDIREDTADIKVEAEQVLEDTRSLADAVAAIAELCKQYAELASQIAYGQKGWFETPEALKATYPEGQNGWWAVVGTTDTIWTWDSDSDSWVDTRQGTDMSKYTTWSQLSNKLLVPCTCTYDAAAHTFRLTRRDVSQELRDGAELTFLPPAAYSRGDTVEFEGEAMPLAYTGSPADLQTGAWLAHRPAKLVWYADNEQGGTQNEPLRARRRTRP